MNQLASEAVVPYREKAFVRNVVESPEWTSSSYLESSFKLLLYDGDFIKTQTN